MKYDEYLWAKAIVFISALAFIFIIIWVVVNPAPDESPINKARIRYTNGCYSHNNGVPNTASNDPKEWTCQTK